MGKAKESYIGLRINADLKIQFDRKATELNRSSAGLIREFIEGLLDGRVTIEPTEEQRQYMG